MPTLKENYIIQKRNVLNEIRANSMTLQELRFFAIYLSKINKDKLETRVVRFTLSDFKSMMGLGSRIKIDYMKKVTNSLLCKVLNVPIEKTGGYTAFQLFKECTVNQDDNGEWYVEIDAHDKALPLMFEYKDKYFSYQLSNALRLGSSNQIHMYELLKQYENTKEKTRVMSVDYLKDKFGIGKNEYSRFGDFKYRVIDPCQKALKEHTDIKFTYEPYGKKGKGGKILNLKFYIEKNKSYIDQLTLDMFIEQNKNDELIEDNLLSAYDERIEFLSGACNDEFSKNEVIVLHDLMIGNLPQNIINDEIKSYNYLQHKYNEMQMRDEKKKIEHRFAYLKSILTINTTS